MQLLTLLIIVQGFSMASSLSPTTVSLAPSVPSIDTFDIWCRMRMGVSPSPSSFSFNTTSWTSDAVFWAGSGALYKSYSGEILANFHGFDVGTGICMESNQVMRQLSRKLFWFTDPKTGDIMTTFHGQPVRPIVYKAQVFEYKRGENNIILPSVVYSARQAPVLPITHELFRNNHHTICTFQAPVFADLDLGPNKRYQAWEFYDYTINLDDLNNYPMTATWCRQGSTAPFLMDQSAVMKYSGQRYNAFHQIPTYMQEYVASNLEYSELFQSPPQSMQEVQGLI